MRKMCTNVRLVTSDILLYLSLSRQNVTVPPKEKCQGLRTFCGHNSGRIEKQTMRYTLTSVGVLTSAPPIPISPKFRSPPYIKVSTISHIL